MNYSYTPRLVLTTGAILVDYSFVNETQEFAVIHTLITHR